MDEKRKFDYFRGIEADQYAFYKIPKVLFSDPYFKDVSVEAKVLYGLMLDRMALSVKNKWLDKTGKAYIYFSVGEVMEALGCKNNKAIILMKELDAETGIGLIEKHKQGQGKPTLIYVKQFMAKSLQTLEKPTSGEKTAIPEVGKTNVLKCENPISRSGKNQLLEVGKSHTNNTDINNTEESNILSYQPMAPSQLQIKRMRDDEIFCRQQIEKNLELNLLKQRNPYETELLDGISELIIETIVSNAPYMIIASSQYPRSLVVERFLQLRSDHIEYVLRCMQEKTGRIKNYKKYLLAALFNAPITISGYYAAEVNHDFAEA